MASIDLCQKLHSKKLSDNSDAIAHIGCLIDMQEQLTALGSTLADKEFTGVILSSLPKSYQDVIQSIAAAVNQMGASITTDRVIWLIKDDYKNHVCKKNNGNDEAFITHTQKRCNMCNIKCYNCHNLGHMKSKCWAKGGNKEGQRPPRHNNYSNSNSNNDSHNNHSGQNSCNNCNNNCNNCNNSNHSNFNNNDSTNAAEPDIGTWAAIKEIDNDEPCTETAYTTAHPIHHPKVETKLYDLGASHHMSPFHHQFRNFHSIPPHPITSADHHTFYATGAGDLQIDVPNSDTTTPITLHITLYVPDMALTIISISCINGAGYNVNFNGKTKPAISSVHWAFKLVISPQMNTDSSELNMLMQLIWTLSKQLTSSPSINALAISLPTPFAPLCTTTP